MHRQKTLVRRVGFTLVELLVVISIIALLMAVLLPALAKAREQAKRIACMSNIKQLTLGWNMYADTNADKIVSTDTPGNGDTTFCMQCPGCPTGAPYIAAAKMNLTNTSPNPGHLKELPWVGGAYSTTQLPPDATKCAIQTGALFKYANDFKIYRCPTANKGELFTYNAMDSMNGMPCDGDYCGRGHAALKNRNAIRKTALSVVFIDEGEVTPDSFAVHYNVESWWDPPEIRHSGGQVFSFVDNHAECWKWSKETLDFAKKAEQNHVPITPECKQDLYKIQYSCWVYPTGDQFGYTPSVKPNVY